MAQGREIAIFMFLIILFFLEKRFPHTLFQFEPHKRENDDGFEDKIFVSLVSVVCFPRFVLGCSVTRFGEISPLWQNFMNLCQMVEGIFSVWQIFEPTLAKLKCFWAAFQCCPWPKIDE